jgi:hypothetical protein
MPFDTIIDSVQCQSLSFTKSQVLSFSAPNVSLEGPGISGKMELADSHCGKSVGCPAAVWMVPLAKLPCLGSWP